MEAQQAPAAPWSLALERLADELDADRKSGLSEPEAARRLERDGPNLLREAARRGPLNMLLRQFADFMIGLLAAAAVVSGVIGEWADSVLIALIVVANAIVGFVQEWRAEKAIEALKELSQPTAKVWRDGRVREIPAAEIVAGDLIDVAGGDFVPADARLIEVADLQTDEAALTGESLPVEKSTEAVKRDTVLPDRTSMLFAGTAVTAGRGRGLVTATGMRSELGHIAAMLESAESQQTPLQRRLARLSKQLAVAVLVVCFLVFVAGIAREPRAEWDWALFSAMLLTAVSLAVAAIPEGLPAVITITLALGSQRMARRNAVVRRLAAVETLGSVDVICSDKTGTLTQNKMAAEDLVPADESNEGLEHLLRAGVLCNDAQIQESGELVGSATETAILKAASDGGLDAGQLRKQWKRVDEIPFSSARKRMSTLHENPDGRRMIFAKGAAETILERSIRLGGEDGNRSLDEKTRDHWRHKADSLADRGRRVLAVASREWNGSELADEADAESSLTFLGLVGLVDPVRPEAQESIARCRSAGIRPVMITGDHAGTAKAIAEELGLWQEGDELLSGPELERADDGSLKDRCRRASVFARVAPEHKLKIVKAHQSHGSVVSMTGDGVNDAPALKQADIGVAMGQTGTDVAKEASEMILADDNFATIVAAVEEGRVVYDNIRKFVRYLLTANVGEIFVLVLAILLGYPLPLLPVHILWINLVTDGLPALALGFEPAEKDIMQRKPRRRDESIFAGGMIWGILLVGLLMSVSCVVVHHLYLTGGWSATLSGRAEIPKDTVAYARSMVFLILSLFQLFYVLALRSTTRMYFELGMWSNYRLTGAVIIGMLLQLAVIYVPVLQPFFHTVSLSWQDLIIGVAVSTLAFFAVEAAKLSRRFAEIE